MAPSQTRSSRSYDSAKWRMLIAVMACYLFMYTGRQNIGFAVQGMRRELGYSATAIAVLNAALLFGYGLGQTITGNLSDKYGARIMVAIGAIGSVVLNWTFSLTSQVGLAACVWGLNGAAQSTAWPAMNRLLANWWPRKERGTAIGLYLLSAGFSSSLTFALCVLVLQFFPSPGGWRWIFRLPVCLILAGGTVFWLLARNRPQDLGFPSLAREDADIETPDRESSWQRYLAVLHDPRFLVLSLSIGCESIARYGLLNWMPAHFLGNNWRTSPQGGWVTVGLPVGMALGALSAGLVADRWFPGHRARLVSVLLGAAAAAVFILPNVTAANPAMAFFLLGAAGFLVYAPQASYWALCPALVGRKRAGTAVGLMDASAYAFAGLGQLAIGWAIDATGSTAVAFPIIGCACIVGAAVVILVRE